MKGFPFQIRVYLRQSVFSVLSSGVTSVTICSKKRCVVYHYSGVRPRTENRDFSYSMLLSIDFNKDRIHKTLK